MNNILTEIKLDFIENSYFDSFILQLWAFSIVWGNVIGMLPWTM